MPAQPVPVTGQQRHLVRDDAEFRPTAAARRRRRRPSPFCPRGGFVGAAAQVEIHWRAGPCVEDEDGAAGALGGVGGARDLGDAALCDPVVAGKGDQEFHGDIYTRINMRFNIIRVKIGGGRRRTPRP